MLAIEELLCELTDEKRNEQGLPPGFRFHPTDEELITFYLASKVFSGSHSADVKLAEVDLNRCEPWELPDVAKMGEREWYLLSSRDRKYPSGLRTNRATGAGYWKATGKDREVYSGWSGGLVGLKKTLVFYKGRAPRGDKTKWVMHEYRLDGHFSYPHTSKEEWVICRIYHKSSGEKRNPMPQGEAANFAVLDVSQSHLFPLHAFPPSFPIFFNTQYQHQRQQLDDANCSLMEKLTPNPIDYHNCLPPEMDSGVLALSAASNATYSDVSALMAFDRAALPRESWPLYFM